jgi:hypothetical protein
MSSASPEDHLFDAGANLLRFFGDTPERRAKLRMYVIIIDVIRRKIRREYGRQDQQRYDSTTDDG